MKVLFIGNSHTYFNDMPQLFASMCKKVAGVETESVMLAYSGRTLEWHIKEYFSIRFNLLYGNYDYCIIQQAAHPFPPEEETAPCAKQIIALCNAAGTVPVLYMTWAEKARPENQREMTDVYTRLAAETGALLAPVGLVWQEVRRRHPEIELYYRDGAHASVYGDYLAAAVFCAVIARGDVEMLDASALDFARGMDIQFERPRVIEDPSALPCRLDPQTCAAIHRVIRDLL